MSIFTLDVGGKIYKIEAPDEASARDAALNHYEQNVEQQSAVPQSQPAQAVQTEPQPTAQTPVEAALLGEGVSPELSLSAKKTPGPEEAAKPEPPAETTPGGVMAAAVRGASPVAAGAALGAAIGAPAAGVGAIPGAIAGATVAAFGDPIVGLVNRVFGTEITKPTDAMQHLLTALGVPEAKTEAERLVQSAAQAGAESFGVGGIGKGLAKSGISMVSRLGTALAAQPVQQAVGAAAGSVASDIAKEMGIGPAGQMLTSVLVGGAASKASQFVPIGVGKETVAAGVREAERLGLAPVTSQAFPPTGSFGKFARNVREAVPEFVPGSLGEKMAKQKEVRDKLVQDFLSQYKAQIGDGIPASVPTVTSDFLKKRKNEIARLTGIKKTIFAKVDSINPRVVPLSSVTQINDEIATLRRESGKAFSPLIKELNSLKDDVQRGMSLSDFDRRRDSFGEILSSEGLGAIKTRANEVGLRVYNAIKQDIRDHILNNSPTPAKDAAAWMKSNAKLSRMVGDLSKANFRSALNKGNATPEAVERLLFSKKPSDAKALYLSLTEKGRNAAKAAIFEKLALDSIKDGVVSANAFATNSKKYAASLSQLLSDQERDQFKGMISALNATKRSQEIVADPPTGARTLLTSIISAVMALAGGVGGTEKAAMTTASLGGGITLGMLYESKAAMNLFAMLSRVKTGSREEQALAKRIIAEFQKLSKQKEQEQQ